MPQNGVYIEGVEYTRSGGTFTFAAELEGRPVAFEYQIQDATVPWVSALGQLGLELALGSLGQPVWSHLTTNHPAQALGYSGIAYVYAASYRLNDSAQVENHNFEISTTTEFSDTIFDANMALVLRQFLTDGLRGVQWPAAYLGDLTDYSNYCVSHGLFMSPALTEQAPAADTMARWLRLTNSDVVMSGTTLKVVPLGDESKTGNGATFTANTTPVYDLGPDDFINEDQPRVRVNPRSNEDVYNVVRVEYRNRENGHNIDIAQARDRAHIDQFGERVMEVIKAHEITNADVAGFAAQMELQRQMAVLNDYEFSVPWTKGRLEPLDLLTLTTGDELDLVRVPVRISTITESDDGQFDITASDAPIGLASAPLFGVQQGSGYQVDFNVAPGNVDAPFIFEAPADQAGNTGLEVCVAVRGAGANWAGCQVWVSLDATNYRLMATVNGSARYGTLSAAAAGGAASIAVQGLGAGQLISGSAVDASQLNTLCFVGGANPEYLAYQTATLTGAGAYTLSDLVHAAYGTAAGAHASGVPFARVDAAVAKSGELDVTYIGKTLHFKFCSFNGYGGGVQSLADVSAYTYAVTGVMAALRPGVAGKGINLRASGLTFQYPKAGGVNPSTLAFTAERKGALTGAVTWSVPSGTATLTGSGDTRSLAPADLSTETATIRATIADAVASYIAEVTVSKVREGIDGAAGAAGLNVARPRIYQRATSTPSLPSATATFTFATGALTGLNNGWSATIPAGSNPLYVSEATASSAGSTDTIASGEWASAVVLAQDGSSGSAGSNGSNGADGLNSATVYLFQRTGSSSAPSLPSATVTYTFVTAVASGVNNGWSQTLPTSGGAYRWLTTAAALSTSSTDTIASGEWASASLLAQDGTNGSNGTNGTSVYTATIYIQASSAPSTPTGGSFDFSSATLTPPSSWNATQPPVSSTPTYTSQFTFATGTPGATVSGGTWTTPQLVQQVGTSGPVNPGPSPSAQVSQTGGSSGVAGVQFRTDGSIYKRSGPNASTYTIASVKWFNPVSGTPGNSYWIRFGTPVLTVISGSPTTGGTFGTLQQLSSTREVTLTAPLNAGGDAEIPYTIYSDSGGESPVENGTISLSAESEP